jgi:hypothetical protein
VIEAPLEDTFAFFSQASNGLITPATVGLADGDAVGEKY